VFDPEAETTVQSWTGADTRATISGERTSWR
jgi:hypothetical protein